MASRIIYVMSVIYILVVQAVQAVHVFNAADVMQRCTSCVIAAGIHVCGSGLRSGVVEQQQLI